MAPSAPAPPEAAVQAAMERFAAQRLQREAAPPVAAGSAGPTKEHIDALIAAAPKGPFPVPGKPDGHAGAQWAPAVFATVEAPGKAKAAPKAVGAGLEKRLNSIETTLQSAGMSDASLNSLPVEEKLAKIDAAVAKAEAVAAPSIRTAPSAPAPPAAEVQAAMERFAAQRLQRESPATPAATPAPLAAPSSELQARVEKARASFQPAVDVRARELLSPDLDEYMADKIDEAALSQRKASARQLAATEVKPLAAINDAYASHSAALAARAAALEAAERAIAAADEAEAKLLAALDQSALAPAA